MAGGLCSDDASMARNNTSAFNCRTTDAGTLSAHGRGAAIDINPIQNPYVRGGSTEPPQGRACDEPHERRRGNPACDPGLIAPGDAVTTAFGRRGWVWGGAWRNSKDYQHFSRGGR